MKVQLLILVATFFYLAYTQLVNGQPHKDCQTSCGNVTIEFPFGTSPDCYYAADPSFNLTCNDKEKLFFRRNLEIINMSHSGELRVMNNISYACYDSQGNSNGSIYYTYRLANLSLSHKNKFTIVGCNAYAYLSTYGTQNYSTGCISACASPPAANGGCHGAGCCSTDVSVPFDNKKFETRPARLPNMTSVYDFNPCTYAFLMENGTFHFNALEDLKNLRNVSQFPLVLDWSIGNQTCEEVGNRSMCGMRNNTCFNSNSRPGYNCKCIEGYEGNPYLGCLGTTIGFLCILLVVSCVQQKMKDRKTAELRQKFFEQNGGGMLVQRLSGPGTSNANVQIFTEEGMKTSTNGYDESRILGQGGQGTVYKGILPDNSIVAIKKARLGDNSQVEQFINEVLVLSQINHRNVVKLLGCCLETEVPLLVYEFINSGTLFDHLHGSLFGPSLTWEQRLRISVEIAGTLAYLHSSASIPIIHRDVKTANILLDENLTAKVADFGASRLIPMDKEQLTTMVQGTLGYLDPEYYNTGLLNEKSDVYSFGVVLMELLSSQKALCFERPLQSKHLVHYIASAMKENRLHEVIDEKVINENNWKEIQEAVKVAMECTRVTGEERPLMMEVAAKLEGLRVTKTKHQWSDQYPGEETENLVGVGILSAQGDTSSTGYDSIKNVASLHVAAGR
ncbi:hypothetical protein Bca4012_054148 [Brassica carinata]